MTHFTAAQTDKLRRYLALLTKWQRTINLVGKNTLPDAWERHIIDSAQLVDYIPEGANVVDLGSGAGFPALVLAMIRPDLTISLIESDERKGAFLRNVSRETSTPVTIHTQRIEDFDVYESYDMITARALSALKTLLDYGENFQTTNPQIQYLFLKGENADAEIAEAQNFYTFDIETHPSVTNPTAKILHLKNVSRETF